MPLIAAMHRKIFGQVDVELCLPANTLQQTSTFVPQYSRRNGYLITVGKRSVIVEPRSVWRDWLGMPSLYIFTGNMPIRHSAISDASLVKGTVALRLLYRLFLTLWFGVVLLSLIVFAGFSLVSVYILISSGAPIGANDLLMIGGLVGGATLVLLFGIGVSIVMKTLYSDQRKRLVQFCSEFGRLSRQRVE